MAKERRTSSWATDTAVDLLNSSKLTSNVSEKLEKLKQIEELFRGNNFNKDDDQESDAKDAMTVVLRPMFESIVTETDPRVRKFGCELSERVCVFLGENMSAVSSASSVSSDAAVERNGGHFACVLESLLVLVSDGQFPAVQKRATAASANAFREVLVNAAIEGANVDPMIDLDDSLDEGEEKTNKQTTKKKTKKKEESRQYSNVALMWEKALALARAISANVSNETVNDGVRMQSAKFCESACLLLAGVGWGASVVKPTHKLLKLDELGKLSDEKRDALGDGLKLTIEKGAKPCGPFTLTLIGALGTVCVKSERHAVESLQALVNASSTLSKRFKSEEGSGGSSGGAISASAKASASKAFAQTFTEIAKKAPSFAISGELKDGLASACRELGATAAFEQAMRQRERERGKSALLKNAAGGGGSSIRGGSGIKRERSEDASLAPLTAGGDDGGMKRARLRAPPPPPPLQQQQFQHYQQQQQQPYYHQQQPVHYGGAGLPMMQQSHHVVSLGGHGIPPPPPPAPLHPRTDPGILRQVLATLEQLAASDLNMLQNFVTQLGTTSPAALADAVLLFFRNPATTLNQAVLGMNFAPTQGALAPAAPSSLENAQQKDLGTGAILSAIARVQKLSKSANRKFALDCAKRIRAYGALRADGDAKANSLSSIRLALIARLACADAIPDGSSVGSGNNNSKKNEDEDGEEDRNQRPPMANETKVGVLKPMDGNLRIASHVADAPMVARSILFPVDDENAPLERDGVQSCARWLAALHAAELAQSLGASSAKAENNKKKKKKDEDAANAQDKDGFHYYSMGVRKDDAIRAVMRILASDPRARRHEISEKRLTGEKKLLSKILCEIPFDIPNKAWDALREMLGMSGIDEYDVSRDEAFSVESNKNDDSVVNLALHVLRDLCVDRPPARANALEILLECATNTDASADERTRAKAIRLVANRLHQQHAAEADASTTGVITTNEVEQYAIKSATENGRDIGAAQLQLANEAIEARAIEKNEAEAIKGMTTGIEDTAEQEGDDHREKEEREEEQELSDPYASAKKIAVAPSLLLCALTAKNPSLLPNVLAAYEALPLELREGLHGPVAGLARRLGPSSPDIVRVIASSTIESRPLILYIVQALAKASAPAPLPKALVNACETLAVESTKKDSSLPDAYMEVALVFGSIEKEKAKELLPNLVDVPSPSAFERAVVSLQNSNLEARASATDVLVALHELDIRTTDDAANDTANKAGVSLKSLVNVCNTCFSADTADYFTSSAVASALSHLVDRTPLPKLFMRTAMLAETAHPSLKEFSLELLEKLAKRKVWTMDRGIWEGFARSCKKAAPRSFPVLANMLPMDKTKEILEKFGKHLRAPLKAYAEATGAKNLLDVLKEDEEV